MSPSQNFPLYQHQMNEGHTVKVQKAFKKA